MYPDELNKIDTTKWQTDDWIEFERQQLSQKSFSSRVEQQVEEENTENSGSGLSDSTKGRMLELMLETDYHCLWDPTNSEFKNRTTRNAIWQKMSELLKTEGHNVESGLQLTSCYSSLKNSYRRIKERMLKGTGLAAGDISWQYFNAFEALEPKWTSGPRMTNVPLTSRSSENEISNSFEMADDRIAFEDRSSSSASNIPRTSSSPTFLVDKRSSTTAEPIRKLQKRKCETYELETTISEYLKKKQARTYVDHLAATLTTLCAELEAKQPGSSNETVMSMIDLIAKSTRKLHSL
ncbi:hypothetical protein WR25_09963 isoform C [Diploscapter pachys]|nr:hypothetical protein WR25_09963 isoform C [Diploscapter pachys]